jgi:hypothetical protein
VAAQDFHVILQHLLKDFLVIQERGFVWDLIKKPGKQVLPPIIIYTDGTATGQFPDLPVTPFKFTLGIFKRKARDRPYMWRT